MVPYVIHVLGVSVEKTGSITSYIAMFCWLFLSKHMSGKGYALSSAALAVSIYFQSVPKTTGYILMMKGIYSFCLSIAFSFFMAFKFPSSF